MTQTEINHEEHAEQCVLGAMLMAPAMAEKLLTEIEERHYYQPKHALIHAAANALHKEGSPVDAITVAERLHALGDLEKIGGAPYLHTLVSTVPASANGPYYARIVREHSERRDLVEHAAYVSQVTASGMDTDVIKERVETHYARIKTSGNTTDVSTMGDWLADYIDHAVESDAPQTITTGLPDLDKLFDGGFTPGQLALVAGRPGMGKTVALTQFAAAAAKTQPTLMVTLEQTREDLTQRLICATTGIEFSAIRKLPWSEQLASRIIEAAPRLPLHNLALEHTARTITDIKRLAYAHHHKRGLKVLVVDYLQLVTTVSNKPSREQEVSEISRELKRLALDLGIVIIAGSQFNRSADSRPDKRPQMSDLRESGSLEQDADIVIMLHRDDYHDKESMRAGEIDLIVAKNRNGPTDTITAAAQLHLMRIVSIALP